MNPHQYYYANYHSAPPRSESRFPSLASVLTALGAAGAVGAAMYWLDRKHALEIESVNRSLASALASAAAAEVTAARAAAAFQDVSDSLPAGAINGKTAMPQKEPAKPAIFAALEKVETVFSPTASARAEAPGFVTMAT